MKLNVTLLTTILFAATGAALAQEAAAPAASAVIHPEFHAVRAAQPPRIDGDLTDAAWAAAPPIEGFTQRDPEEGKPASEKTVVRIMYDDDAIYVAASLDDSHPVTTQLGRRDSSLQSDWFRIYFDPHLDRRSGAGFWVNPSNVQLDMILYNDGWDDPDWDAVWSSAAVIREGGWNVEMRIPLSQLRFPDRDKHTWGLNIVRTIVRRNEHARLVHTPKNESGFSSRFGNLLGIAGIHPKRALEVMPYAVSRADFRNTVERDDPFNSRNEVHADLGLDVKYGLTSNLTLTGTLNPDFGQVEVDPASVNLSQFELFFNEKRPFFVEGANLFQFGSGGSNWNMNFGVGQPSFFYSRRIGREPQALSRMDYDYLGAPRETTILGAAKLTGKTGNGFTVAVLDAVTDEENAFTSLERVETERVAEPMTNYLVTRVAKDIGERGRIGALFTSVNRDLDDDLNFLRTNAYAGGLDGYWTFGKKDVIVEGFLAGSMIEGSQRSIDEAQRSPARYYQRPDADHVEFDGSRDSLTGWGGRLAVVKQTGKWRYNVKAESYSPGFETNDVGFMTRTDFTSTHAGVMYSNPDVGKVLRDRGWMVAKYQNWNHDGDLLNNGLYAEWWGTALNYWSFWTNSNTQWRRYDDRATRGGPVMQLPQITSYAWEVVSDSRKKFSAGLFQQNYWNELGGYDHGGSLRMTYRPTSNLKFEVTPFFGRNHSVNQYVRTQFGDPAASATYNNRYVFAQLDQRTFELGTRIDWTYSSRLTFQLYLQPFIASGDYHHFKELAAPRTMDYIEYQDVSFDGTRYTIDPDGALGEGKPFSFRNPDFNYRSVRGSAVVRWEFRPGSALYVVWNENRENQVNIGDFSFNRDLSAIGDIDSDDVLLLKVSYWLPM